MNECVSLTNNHSLNDELLDDLPINANISSTLETRRRPLEGLLKNLSSLKDPQLAYQQRDSESQYRTVPNGFNDWNNAESDSDEYEQTFYCRDHGEVASDPSKDESDVSDDECQNGEFVSYWQHREIGWNDSQIDERNHDHIDNHRNDAIADVTRDWRWFQGRNNRESQDRKHRECLWGFGKRRPPHEDAFDQTRQEIVLYCVPDVDEHEHHDSDDSSDDCGHVMVTPMHPNEQKRPESPFSFGRRGKKCNNHDGRARLANLPIVRPFLVGQRSIFKDNPTGGDTIDDDNQDQTTDFNTADNPSRQDRDSVIQSISEGIAVILDNSLALDTEEATSNRNPNEPPRIFRPIARLFRGPRHHRSIQVTIKEFHRLLRKEDWTLATAMLRSNPDIPRTWHSVERLYGGRYDGEVLPLHAACALRPPVSFIEELASIYPEALMAKEKSFGRVPLHVACRSLAHSSVIEMLCKMEPKCVMETDSLKRVALHYLIKNYATLGDDAEMDDKSETVEIDQSSNDSDKDINEDDSVEIQILEKEVERTDQDGLAALKILLNADPKCARIADHRRWIPLHVACSSSSRKGMTNVIKLLLHIWPESVLCKTSKRSDVFDCVDMAGQHHPTKELVLSILREAHEQVHGDSDKQNTDAEKTRVNDAQIDFLDFQNGDCTPLTDEVLINLDIGGTEEHLIDVDADYERRFR